MINGKTAILHCSGEFADRIVSLKDSVVTANDV